MRNHGREKGFSLMELLVAIGIMAAIAAVTIPLVTKFVDRGQSGAQTKEFGACSDFNEVSDGRRRPDHG
ncbi:MAG: prepilin-type N-terminal cleavage/methylation domain-containing protein [Chloroflexi bacterium]|nr:prepilin-type N-terminal cleavage/methylation domain-containing protein [Chloroflexota bacterium]